MGNTLVEIVTSGNANGLSPKTIKRHHYPDLGLVEEMAILLWGVIYERTAKIHDGYGPYDYHFVRNKQAELVYEGIETGTIYFVEVNPFTDVPSLPQLFGREDSRHRIFGHPEVFKAFFRLLHDDLRERELGKEDYMSIRAAVLTMNWDIYSTSLNSFALHKLMGLEMVGKYIRYNNLNERIATLILQYLSNAKAAKKH